MVARAPRISHSECATFYKADGLLVTDNQLCFENSLYIVPNSCELDQGGPVGRKYHSLSETFFPYQLGISIHGRDCSFGYPAVATRVSRYIDWIDSIIFVKKPAQASLGVSDACKLPNGQSGLCKRSSQCQHVVRKINRGEIDLIEYECDFSDNSDPVVCCPPQRQDYDFASKFKVAILYFKYSFLICF